MPRSRASGPFVFHISSIRLKLYREADLRRLLGDIRDLREAVLHGLVAVGRLVVDERGEVLRPAHADLGALAQMGRPHGEEHRAAMRLEPWPQAQSAGSSFEAGSVIIIAAGL